MKQPLVYYIEDEESIRELVAYVLRGQQFTVETFLDSTLFWEALEKEEPQLVLLDLMLPHEDGLQILKKMRQSKRWCHIPIIMVTAKTTELDVVQGLDSGADDYITKPFSVVELTSRVKALLRRSQGWQTVTEEDQSLLRSHEVSIHKKKRRVLVNEQELELTLKEYELLLYLIENEDFVLTREQMMHEVWDFAYEGETRTVDMHIMSLRQKLGVAGTHIKTVRGMGYRWKGETP